MLKVKLVSDLHTEFYTTGDPKKRKRILERYLPPQEADAETVLCLAGDTGLFSEFESTIRMPLQWLSDRFRAVVVVGGNHELYRTQGIWRKEQAFLADKGMPVNIHWLDNDFVRFDGVTFLGTTLWTDFDRRNPLAMRHAARSMNDFRRIRTDRVDVELYGNSQFTVLTPEETVERHEESVQWLKECLTLFKGERPVVLTHHAPSMKSVGQQYAGDLLNYAYATSLDELIEQCGPGLWLHGHTHTSFDYVIGGTRVVTNPCGYHNYALNYKFDKNFVVEL